MQNDIQKIIYSDYAILKQMQSPLKAKIRILSELLCQRKDAWKVVKISWDALQNFAKHSFKSVSKQGINRSHYIQDRCITNQFLLEHDLSFNEFWATVNKFDKTAITTSSENKTKKYSPFYDVDQSLNLFEGSGYKWKHNKKEQEYLQKLYEKVKL